MERKANYELSLCVCVCGGGGGGDARERAKYYPYPLKVKACPPRSKVSGRRSVINFTASSYICTR